MKTLSIVKSAALATVMALTAAACSSFDDDTNPYGVSEAQKNLSGVWKLQNVTRNDVDITQDMDFTQFALHMEDDGTYHIENYLPFVVSQDGTWATDDAQFPFRLTFTENGAQQGTQIDINYPIVNGERSLSITLSPGCSSNTYTYTLTRQKETNNQRH